MNIDRGDEGNLLLKVETALPRTVIFLLAKFYYCFVPDFLAIMILAMMEENFVPLYPKIWIITV